MKEHLKTHPWVTKALLLIFLVLAFWLPRGLALDRFVTVDEPKWLVRSANFYQALILKDFVNTYQKEHPGVTTMWAGTLGYLWRYPEYVKETPGQQNQTKDFKAYLEHRSYEPIKLLDAGRHIMVIGGLVVMAFTFLAATRLVGVLPAVVGFLLMAFDPFLIALSRLLHLDGLMGALMLLALLEFMNYLYNGRRIYDLSLAAIAAGLAFLTKSPSLFLIPFFGLLSLVEIGCTWWTQRQLSLRDVWRFVWPLLAWTGIAALVFVLLWPAMWVDPIGSLLKVFGGAVDYAERGHYGATFFNGQIYAHNISDLRFYPINYLWRTTPPVLIGLLLSGTVLIFRHRLSFPKNQQRASMILILYAVLFTIFMTAGAKKFDRYLIPIFAPLDLVAALGWIVSAQNAFAWTSARWNFRSKEINVFRFGTIALLTIVLLTQIASSIGSFPYYFTYYNPLMGGSRKAPDVMMIGWGEGLDEAARYLNTKPDADELTVHSWYPDGSFSYIFNGKTIYDEFEADPKELIKRADYYVIYFHQRQRLLPSEEFISYFDQQKPEYVVNINGLEYARIYRRE